MKREFDVENDFDIIMQYGVYANREGTEGAWAIDNYIGESDVDGKKLAESIKKSKFFKDYKKKS